MVLPEPSRTVTYTTRNTVNILAYLLISNPVVLELSKEKEPCTSSSRNLARSDSCKKHKNCSRQAYSFLEGLCKVRMRTADGGWRTADGGWRMADGQKKKKMIEKKMI